WSFPASRTGWDWCLDRQWRVVVPSFVPPILVERNFCRMSIGSSSFRFEIQLQFVSRWRSFARTPLYVNARVRQHWKESNRSPVGTNTAIDTPRCAASCQGIQRAHPKTPLLRMAQASDSALQIAISDKEIQAYLQRHPFGIGRRSDFNQSAL